MTPLPPPSAGWRPPDAWIVGLAGSTAAGAWLGPITPRAPIALLLTATTALALCRLVPNRSAVGSGSVSRTPTPGRWLLGLAVCLASAGVAAMMAQRAVAGLVPPGDGPVVAEVTLVADPAPLPRGGGTRAEVRYRGKRVAIVAYRSAAAALDRRLAGERVSVVGDLSPPGPYERRLAHRHLAGRLRIETVTGWRPGHGVATAANRLRRTLERGSLALPERQRGLFLGVVAGDDRAQPADMVAAFRTSGLGHITAVSGQNVAFVLAAVAPVLRRLRLAPRLLVTVGLLALFAVLTRAEPSVLRATGMAAVAAYGAAVGRPTTGLRALGLTVTALVLCDPLLVTSLGFRLSVAGAAGIVIAAAPLRRRLPGPEWLAAPVAVMLAAQLAVAPLLVGAFGSVALVSLPANLVAAPAVGPVMAWGLVAGLVGRHRRWQRCGCVAGSDVRPAGLDRRGRRDHVPRRPLAHISGRDLAWAAVFGAVVVAASKIFLRRSPAQAP